MSGFAAPIKIGVSSCLLGEKVRYDGGHKHDPYLTSVLGRFFSFVPVCPEVECGMTTPREAMRLEGDPGEPRLMTHRTRIDKTEQMLEFCRKKVEQLAHEDLCGFVFKKGSPSSGLFRVKVYREGLPPASGSGLFAAAVVRRFPQLPVEEEGRLNDPVLRENFIERVFAFRRWKDFLAQSPDLGKLVQFHTCQKLLIMSHSTQLYRDLGALVARGKELPLTELLERYQELYMGALALHATVKKQTNVLMHVMGYFKKHLTAEEKQELLQLIEQYHDGLVPLVVPLTLLKHYVVKYRQEYLQQQVYLAPHPAELMLRNHV
ncbi:YbgA family protein [Geomonas anaerohicana]|uniref:DUF523 and DUF1722 domain-containing protein n=1 Tax=Geomonas anaerohicana TaxID=2798583 RepID=A0ABS0YDY6_9BACT|nr:DUF523 and DUF1722 domain-containing protein [Geomonas anaerohicana]MBJ6750506.1 DUF523 and DUF1722 domain-containing protein [Geomonas anaerohicana]